MNEQTMLEHLEQQVEKLEQLLQHERALSATFQAQLEEERKERELERDGLRRHMTQLARDRDDAAARYRALVAELATVRQLLTQARERNEELARLAQQVVIAFREGTAKEEEDAVFALAAKVRR